MSETIRDINNTVTASEAERLEPSILTPHSGAQLSRSESSTLRIGLLRTGR